MPYPDRGALADALICLMAAAQGEVNVREDRIVERLADEFQLTQAERDARYEGGLNRWEQTIFVLRQHLIKKGILAKGTRRGFWALTPKGMELGLKLLEQKANKVDKAASAAFSELVKTFDTPEYLRVDDFSPNNGESVAGFESGESLDEPSTIDFGDVDPEDSEVEGGTTNEHPRDALSVLETLGFAVRRASEGSLHEVRSPLSGVTFEAVVLVAEDLDNMVFRVPNKPLLIIVGGEFTDNGILGVFPEGTMIVRRHDLDALCDVHQELPFSLDEIVDAFVATARDGGETAIQDLIEGRGQSARSIELARILLEHGQLRARHGEMSPIRAEQVYWFLFAQPEYRGRYQLDEIEQVLNTLSSPAVGAFRNTESGYVQVMTPEIAARRLAALGTLLPFS